MFTKINQTSQLKPYEIQGQHLNRNEEIATKGKDFRSILSKALETVNEVENEANVKQQLYSVGKIDDLHDVMIAAQRATITIEAAVQVQQKVIDAYNEVMRMQI